FNIRIIKSYVVFHSYLDIFGVFQPQINRWNTPCHCISTRGWDKPVNGIACHNWRCQSTFGWTELGPKFPGTVAVINYLSSNIVIVKACLVIVAIVVVGKADYTYASIIVKWETVIHRKTTHHISGAI